MQKSMTIVIFQLFLSAFATFFGVMGVWEDWGVSAQPTATEALNEAITAMKDIKPGTGLGETLFALYQTTTNSFYFVASAVFAGPEMLIQIGVPAAVVVVVWAPAPLIVGSDMIYMLTGRRA